MGMIMNYKELARIRRILAEEDWEPAHQDYGLASIDMGFMEEIRCKRCGSTDTRQGTWCEDCGQAALL